MNEEISSSTEFVLILDRHSGHWRKWRNPNYVPHGAKMASDDDKNFADAVPQALKLIAATCFVVFVVWFAFGLYGSTQIAAVTP